MIHFRSALAVTSLAILFAGCDDSTSAPKGDPAKAGDVYVLGQKYGTGGASSLDRIRDGAISSVGLSSIPAHSNTGIASDSDLLFLFDKTLGVLTAFAGGDPSQVAIDANVGSSANPYDAVVLGGRVWVARYGAASLLALDRSSGKAVDSIDLSAYADSSTGVPNMMAVVRWNGKLVVPVQRLDADWTAAESSLVLIVDPTTRKVVQRIALPFGDVGDVTLRGDILVAGCIGGWGSTPDGGLVVVDLASGSVTRSIPGADLGGDPAAVEFTADQTVWIATSYPDSRARSVDLSSGKPGKYFAGASNVGDLAFDGNALWIANHSDTDPFVYRVDPNTASQLGVVRSTLAPSELRVIE